MPENPNKRRETGAWRSGATQRLNEDGSMRHRRSELMAIAMADGVTSADAWEHIEDNEGELPKRREYGRGAYRVQCAQGASFKRRLAQLKEEREKLMADDIYGDAKWAAKQIYRVATAKGDIAGMQKAATLLADIAKSQGAATPGSGRGPGRPATPSMAEFEAANGRSSPEELARKYGVSKARETDEIPM